MPDVSVLVPWRTDNGPREVGYRWVMPRWEASGLEVVEGRDSGVGLWNISQALNDARSRVTGDYLVVMGADHIPDPDHIRARIAELDGGPWCVLFAAREVLTEKATQRLLAGRTLPPGRSVLRTRQEAPGIVAVRADVWDALGGRDERFAGWGGEDRAFNYAITTLFGPSPAPRGTVRDLWHPEVPRSERARNHPLRDRYAAASGHAEAISELLAEAKSARSG